MAITPHNIGRSDGEFDVNAIKVLGKKVAIRKHEISHEEVRNGVIIPSSANVNTRMVKGTVLSVGDDAIKDYNIKVGDIILYDALSVFRDTHPVVITNGENVLCKVGEEK